MAWKKAFPDALRAINAAGGNITKEWLLERALEIADKATGARILSGIPET